MAKKGNRKCVIASFGKRDWLQNVCESESEIESQSNLISVFVI